MNNLVKWIFIIAAIALLIDILRHLAIYLTGT